MDQIVPTLLENGLMGAAILMQMIVIRRLYGDLATAREEVDDAREDHLADLREMNTRPK